MHHIYKVYCPINNESVFYTFLWSIESRMCSGLFDSNDTYTNRYRVIIVCTLFEITTQKHYLFLKKKKNMRIHPKNTGAKVDTYVQIINHIIWFKKFWSSILFNCVLNLLFFFERHWWGFFEETYIIYDKFIYKGDIKEKEKI